MASESEIAAVRDQLDRWLLALTRTPGRLIDLDQERLRRALEAAGISATGVGEARAAAVRAVQGDAP